MLLLEELDELDERDELSELLDDDRDEDRDELLSELRIIHGNCFCTASVIHIAFSTPPQ